MLRFWKILGKKLFTSIFGLFLFVTNTNFRTTFPKFATVPSQPIAPTPLFRNTSKRCYSLPLTSLRTSLTIPSAHTAKKFVHERRPRQVCHHAITRSLPCSSVRTKVSCLQAKHVARTIWWNKTFPRLLSSQWPPHPTHPH